MLSKPNCSLFAGLSKIDDVSTMFEMIINLVFKQNNQQYHLYATSTGGDILAMVWFMQM